MLKQDKNTIAVIGSGFSGLTASAVLATEGHSVDVYEKNDQLGGRARQFGENGFKFDMGPSWYWMPDVFEEFFNKFGHTQSDFYELKKLDPGFQIIFPKNELLTVPANWNELLQTFETLESGSASKLESFIDEAEYKYRVGLGKLAYKPGMTLRELLDKDLFSGLLKLQVFTSFQKHVRSFFKHPQLIALMEFPILFLGALPKNTPALYSLMNYSGLKQGTFYPMGGFKAVTDALVQIAKEQGVQFHTNHAISSIEPVSKSLIKLHMKEEEHHFQGIVASADYHHVESLLSESSRNYGESYWNSRVMAPSSLIFYLGVDVKIQNLEHHNLFFDADFDGHSEDIYTHKQWPTDPLFYVCCPSKTDSSTAPAGNENLFLLMPIAPGLEDSQEMRDQFFEVMIQRLEKFTGQNIADQIVYKRAYCVKDFVEDYNSFKGNAYGLANTLKQTANLKPSIQNRRHKNLFYAGQLTVPGPGVPPAIISGQLAAKALIKHLQH